MQRYGVSSGELRAMPGKELMEKLDENGLSVLKTLGADALLEEMIPVGNICHGILELVCAEKDDGKLRQNLWGILRSVAPTKLLRHFPQEEHCIVIGFNHPSLGEILRLLYLGIRAYPDRDFLFPVNLPWYETLTQDIPKLRRLGVYITPMITPSSEEKLRALAGEDRERLEDIQRCKTIFERRYMKTAREFARRNAVIVVAPSARRQATVFPSEETKRGEGHLPPTMTFLSRMVLTKEEDEATFLPVVIIEPPFNNRRLNLFKKYLIYPCRPFETEEVRRLTASHGRDFDYLFLKRLESFYRHKRLFRPTGETRTR